MKNYQLSQRLYDPFLFVLGYKEAFANERLWGVLAQVLGGLLRKEFDARTEDDRLIIERILILVRNILEV